MTRTPLGHRRPRRVRRALPARPASGVATLTIVMLLFFVMAMVAAYANRNLIYEQRVSVNNYRATTATSAADAGIDWAVAMLSGGRLDATCQPSVNVADSDFRSRYFQTQADGSYNHFTWVDPADPVAPRPRTVACVMTDAPVGPGSAWQCSCPIDARPTLPFVQGPAPVFRLEFIGMPGSPGRVVVRARGCSSMGYSTTIEADPNQATACQSAYGSVRPWVDAVTDLQITLGLARALPIPPVAALTVGDTITMAGANLLTVSNPDARTGVTLHTGRPIVAATPPALIGPAGSRGAGSTSLDDPELLLRSAPPAGRLDLFQTLFGMDAGTYSRQPSSVMVNCPLGCTSASIAGAVANNPGRVIWVAGDINLNDAGALGTAAVPVMLVATGDVRVSAVVTVNGFVFSGRDIQWAATAAGSTIIGSVVATRNFQGDAPVTIAYDADIMQRISLGYGSFVRVPGSWQNTTLQ
ncbi:hypothetical protein [Ideonella sp. A 288]|uniref:hypothetical protein n=1 Tax=Ideonella sp. A 288 TaxID=1962181 RepID=UPI001185F68B|nr:hypothetical protein [Ideonella sp. A 288]